MNFTERFKELAGRMSDFLEDTTVEILVRNGFRVGTAGKLITYRTGNLANTTINTLIVLTNTMKVVDGNPIEEEFLMFLDEAFRLIEKVPPSKLLKETKFSPSTIANIKRKGSDGNYQTSKFLTMADKAKEIVENL